MSEFADKRVLVVDDDENMREAMRETVARMGIAVDVAMDGKEGFEKASSRPYDLVISDMRMPEVDGITMFDMMKNSGVTAPVCFVTAYGTVDGAVEALKNGAYDYILKPFSPEVVEELVRRTFALGAVTRESEKPTGDAVYRSAYMARLFSLARDVADSEATVLITGASGTGKEVVARYIHDNSGHANGPFIAVNCAAIPDNLMESELFGYEKGAFTGAVAKKPGKFELAMGGTLLLDEIGEIPLHLQAKLLRVLQEKEVERLGGTKPVKIDTRILATTNRNLKDMAADGEFREDLYYRLNVITIELPPLSERVEDIPELAAFFVKKYCRINKRPAKRLSDDAMAALKSYGWPGNVRELEHTIERSVVLAKEDVISEKDLFLHGITVSAFRDEPTPAPKPMAKDAGDMGESGVSVGSTIAEMERDLILKTLKDVGGNRTKAAEMLGITVRTLRNKLNEYRESGLDVDEFLS